MRVRSKLSLATGFGLLLLLAIFYVGGRFIVVKTFRRAEREVLKAIPSLRQTLGYELSQLDALAAERATWVETCRFMEGGDPEYLRANLNSNALAQLGVHLYLLARLDGEIAAVSMRDRKTGEEIVPAASIVDHFGPGSRLLAATNAAASAGSGLIMLQEGPMLVVARPVVDTLTFSQPQGVLVIGRYFQDRAVLGRVASILPALGGGAQELQVRPPPRRVPESDGQGNDILREFVEVAGFGSWRDETGLEVRLPVYDLYGRPALSLVVALPRTFSSLAELALAWLTLWVAATGILFVVPVFVVQGRTILNPLTRLAERLREFENGAVAGRRLGWKRQDEFGVVARAVDQMLDSIEQVHQNVVDSEQRTRALLEANPDLFFVFDREGTILDASARRGDNPLLPADDVTGRNIRHVTGIDPEIAQRLLDRLAVVLRTGRMQLLEYSLRKPEGHMFWGEARIVRIREDRAMVIVRDITEQRQGEDARQRLEEKMQQVQKLESLGVLAGGIAHDFNNILAAILGHTEQAHLQLSADAPARAAVDSIRRSALRASGLTKQMLAYAGQGTFQFRLVDLNLLVSDMSQLLLTSLSKKASLQLDLAPSLPMIEGDPSQLWQVAMNLLINASDALEGKPGRIELRTRHLSASEGDLAEYISIRPLVAGDYIQLAVSDTGRGMDTKTAERIFDPFFSTKAVGRGLGLSSVLGIIRAHHGGIALQSVLGSGSVFRIVLPAARGADGRLRFEANLPEVPVPPPAAAVALRRRVLLAEDEIDIRKLTTLVLQSMGCETLSAMNGREAVECFRTHADEIDVILMDVEMPEMNGEEALRAIRQIRPDVPVVIMSGYGDVATRERFAGLAPAGFLAKPFARDDLVAVILAAQGSRR